MASDSTVCACGHTRDEHCGCGCSCMHFDPKNDDTITLPWSGEKVTGHKPDCDCSGFMERRDA